MIELSSALFLTLVFREIIKAEFFVYYYYHDSPQLKFNILFEKTFSLNCAEQR